MESDRQVHQFFQRRVAGFRVVTWLEGFVAGIVLVVLSWAFMALV